VIDFDVGLRNLDLIMGCERRVVYDLINVIQGEANLNQALIKDKQCDNLYVLAASQTRDKEALTAGRRREGAGRPGRDGLRVHRLRLAGRHRDRRADGHALCRRGAGGHQPRGLLGARQRPHPGHAGLSKTKRAIDGKEPVKEHLLITRYNPCGWKAGRCCRSTDIQRDPAHSADRRDPRERSGAGRVQPGRARHPPEGGTDVAEAYKDVVAASWARAAAALHRGEKVGFFKRLFGGR
jgi:septum site-determining protein MinD